MSPFEIPDAKAHHFCKVVSEFSLEYRTTKERVVVQRDRKVAHRERNKTRGKMITEVRNNRKLLNVYS